MEKLQITPNFVDSAFEQSVISLMPKKAESKKKLQRNQIVRYGSKVPYDNFIKSEKIPEIFMPIGNKIAFDSVTINEYYPGQEIVYHTDKPKSGNAIYVVSLLSDAVMKFRKGEQVLSFVLPRYSLAVFSEELRWEWEHSVRAEHKRYSVVFRNSLDQLLIPANFKG